MPIEKIRDILQRTASTFDENFALAREMSREDLEALSTAHIGSKTLRGARKRVGATEFPAFLSTPIRGAAGEGQDVLDETEAGRLDRGLGLTRARTDTVLGAGPLLDDDRSPLMGLAEALRSGGLAGLLSSATADELTRARSEVTLFLDAFASFGGIASRAIAPGAFGLDALAKSTKDIDPPLQQMLLLLWVGLRRLPETEQAPEILSTGAEWLSTGAPSFEALQLMAKEIPAFASLLVPKRLAAALRTERAMERYMQAFGEVAREHPVEVHSFIDKHPDVKELIHRIDDP